MKTQEYINSLTVEQIKNNVAVMVVLGAKLPVAHKEETYWDDEDRQEVTWQKPLGKETLNERFMALAQRSGYWTHGTIWHDLFEAVAKKPEAFGSFVLDGEFIHRAYSNDAVKGYEKIRESDCYRMATWQKKYPVRELLATAWEDLRNQVRAFKALRREFEETLDQIPAIFKLGSDADRVYELRSYGLPWAHQALTDYKNGRWPKKCLRGDSLVTVSEDWGSYVGHHWIPVASDYWMPKSVRLSLERLSGNSSVADEIFERLQAAAVSVSMWFTDENAGALQIISVYRAEQQAGFERGICEGKKAFRQGVRSDPGTYAVSGLTGTTPVSDMPLSKGAYYKAYGVGVSRGFRVASQRFTEKVERMYRKAGASESVAKQLAHFAANPNWRGNLSGWYVAVKGLLRQGVAVTDIRSLKTDFVRWEVGGTYRHRTLIVCDIAKARSLLEGVPSDRMSPQGGSTVRALFGCTSKSRAGFVINSEGIEIYADQ